MRKDMFKVIVERGRVEGHGGILFGKKTKSKTYKKMKSKWKSSDDDIYEIQNEKPSKESIQFGLGYNRKSLNENLSPLRRFLKSRLGKPWNKVWSEICAEINSDSTVQKHVLDHARDYAVHNVYMKHGKPYVTGYRFYNGEREVHAENFRYEIGYVHPTTGIFTKIPKAPVKSKKEKPIDFVKISEDQQMHKIGANWFIVEVVAYDKKYDSDIRHITDVLLGKYIRDFYTYVDVHYSIISGTKTNYKHTSEASIWRKKYHGDYYGISKKSANTKEIKKYIG